LLNQSFKQLHYFSVKSKMTTRQVLIIEDTASSVTLLKDYLAKLPFFKVAAVCSSYSQSVEFLSNHHVDLIFLDIELSSNDGINLTGMDLLKTFPVLPPTIITTSHDSFAVESYRIGKASDYLMKPFDFERFLIAINRAMNLQLVPNRIVDKDFIFLKMGRNFKRFEFDEIDYLEAYGIYVKVFVNGTVHVVNDTISALAERIDSNRFMRVHKSFIVNINKITGFNHNELHLKNGKVPIGISYKTLLEPLLSLFDKL
jgi:DNA-binding LytR/AlgR family response regulator